MRGIRTGGDVDVLLLHDWPSGLVTRGAPDPFAGTGIRPWFVGNAHARALIEALAPRLALCGHLHTAYRGAIGTTSVRCLASVAEGDAACALFRTQAGRLAEV
jgi:Icc-related predicted phosphoesterase